MTHYKITYNGCNTQAKLRVQHESVVILGNNANEAVVKFYRIFMNDEYWPQEDGSIHDEQGREIMAAGDDCIEYDGGRFTAVEMLNL